MLDWNNPEETDEERQQADSVIETPRNFSAALHRANAQWATRSRATPPESSILRQRRLKTATMPTARSFHLTARDSIDRTEEDYNVILNGLDSSVTGWIPDVGHIANGGMDLLPR